MSDTKELLERALRQAPLPEHVMQRLIRRRARRQRNRRIAAAVLAMIVALISFAALIRTFRGVERPADEPTDIFARVHGWIAYNYKGGIWAVDPKRPYDQVLLSDESGGPLVGEPLAWSADGSKLLISLLEGDVFVLNADGTETTVSGVADMYPLWTNASLSPDGSQVVYAGNLPKNDLPSAIYVVDSGGGTPQLLRSSRRGWFDQAFHRTGLFNPTFSPDGTKIAYFDGMGDWGNSLRVMNADGTGVRVLSKVEVYPDHLAWSPDGSRLVFHAFTYEGEHAGWGIWVIGADGSGLTEVIRGGRYPYLSPNGSRIAYLSWDRPIRSLHGGKPFHQAGPRLLEMARLDGTHVQKDFGKAASAGPWNPLPLSASGESLPTATKAGPGDVEPAATEGGSGVAAIVFTIVLLGVVGVLFLAWRARRRTAAR